MSTLIKRYMYIKCVQVKMYVSAFFKFLNAKLHWEKKTACIDKYVVAVCSYSLVWRQEACWFVWANCFSTVLWFSSSLSPSTTWPRCSSSFSFLALILPHSSLHFLFPTHFLLVCLLWSFIVMFCFVLCTAHLSSSPPLLHLLISFLSYCFFIISSFPCFITVSYLPVWQPSSPPHLYLKLVGMM